MKNLIIIGAGGFAREAMEIALDIQEQQQVDWKFKGFLTDIPGDFYEKDTLGYEILGDITNHKIEPNAVYAFAIADIPFKRKITKKYLDMGANFISLIHPSCVIGRTVKIGQGCIISSRVTITANVTVGEFVRIGGGTSVGHDVSIGDYSVISGTCGLNGYVKVGQGVFMGSHSCICPHAQIEDFANVGAGSVVLKKVKNGITVFGNPAKKLNL